MLFLSHFPRRFGKIPRDFPAAANGIFLRVANKQTETARVDFVEFVPLLRKIDADASILLMRIAVRVLAFADRKMFVIQSRVIYLGLLAWNLKIFSVQVIFSHLKMFIDILTCRILFGYLIAFAFVYISLV